VNKILSLSDVFLNQFEHPLLLIKLLLKGVLLLRIVLQLCNSDLLISV
jgi:hypothetical protein